MTSRLPQIWINMTRQSVEGLSILLFLAAFGGNLLYSISILSNPQSTGPTARAYLAESIPFLLGSGGTLIFDAIIVVQWIAWRGKSPEPIAYVRRHARRRANSYTGVMRSRSRSNSLIRPGAVARSQTSIGLGRSRSAATIPTAGVFSAHRTQPPPSSGLSHSETVSYSQTPPEDDVERPPEHMSMSLQEQDLRTNRGAHES